MSNQEQKQIAIPYESILKGDILQAGDQVCHLDDWLGYYPEAYGHPCPGDLPARRPFLRAGEKYLLRDGQVAVLTVNIAGYLSTHPWRAGGNVFLPDGRGARNWESVEVCQDDIIGRILKAGEKLREGDVVFNGQWRRNLHSDQHVVGKPVNATGSYMPEGYYYRPNPALKSVVICNGSADKKDALVGAAMAAVGGVSDIDVSLQEKDARIRTLKSVNDKLEAEAERLHGLWHAAEEKSNVLKVENDKLRALNRECSHLASREATEKHQWKSEAERWRKVAEDNVNCKNAWEDTAAQMLRNTEFYQGIVREIGGMFGLLARIRDDGSVCEDVLALKVPKLVENLIVTLNDMDVQQHSSI